MRVFWRIARLKVSPAFSKAAGCRGGAPARAPQSAELSLCLFKRRRGSKGEPSPGVPPFLYASACAPIRWEVVDGLSCHSTPFLWCLPKETVSSRQRKALFYPGGPTIRVSAPASVVVTHPSPTWGGAGAGRDRFRLFCAVSRPRGRHCRYQVPPTAKSAFLWGSTPFLCARAKKWGGTGSRGKRLLPKKTAHTYRVKTRSFPPLPVN